MPLVDFFVLILLFTMAGYIGFNIYINRKRSIKAPKAPPSNRMLVAMRRRPGALQRLSEMSIEDQKVFRGKIKEDWITLTSRWSQHGTFTTGFSKPNFGLASGNADDWSVFGFYDLPSYDAFNKCVKELEDVEFGQLRAFCDIRIILGSISDDPALQVTAIF